MKRLNNITALIAALTLAFPITASAVERQSYREDHDKVLAEAPAPTELVPVTVKVRESNVRREIDKDMLGMQFESMSSEDSVFPDTASVELSEEFLEFADTLFELPLARWGGATAEEVNVLNNLGPMSARTPSLYTEYDYAVDNRGKFAHAPMQFGIVEWIKTVTAVNPDVKLIVCLSMHCATPEENANLARFLLDEKDESSWGALRASYGIPDPVNLLAFELGNEVDLYANIGTDRNRFWVWPEHVDWYCDMARKNIDAIKAVHPEAKFMGCGKSSPQDNDPVGWGVWDTKIAEAIGEDMEYYAFHLYHGGYHLAYSEHWLDETAEHLKSVLGEDYPVKIYMTEHATWPNDGLKDMWADGKVLSLLAQLDHAQFLNRMYMRNDVYGANYHNWNASHRMWAWIKKYDGEWLTTGLDDISRLYDENLGDRIVDLDLESDSLLTDKTSTASVLTAIATPKGDNEMTLIINNKSQDAEFDLTFDFENDYTLTKETVFTAPNLQSYVCSVETRDIFTTTVTEKNEANFKTYRMPAKSTVVLNLTTKSKLPKFGQTAGGSGSSEEAVYSGDEKFTDIAYCWAKNEINLMAERNLLEGTGGGLFEPGRAVTRAEAAKLISAAAEIPEKDYTGLFDDVTADNIFAPWIQTMYSQGYMFGKSGMSFAPDDSITVEELSLICSRIYSGKNLKKSAGGDLKLLDSFKYKESISDWAVNSMAFCVEKGLFNRMYETGELNPQKEVTRAEMAYVLYRLINVE